MSGKLKGFGFCDYESPEDVLRAIKILNGYKIGDQALIVSHINIATYPMRATQHYTYLSHAHACLANSTLPLSNADGCHR